MKALARALVAGALVAFAPAASAADPDAALDAGRRIYRDGVLPSGAPLEAVAAGDVPLRGGAAACASCHGRSGLGYPEGDRVPLPVTAPALYTARWIERRELYAARHAGPGTRPAYDDASLARALRDGVDPAGRPLAAPMPRYRLDDGAMRSLAAYLRTLGAARAPGVTDTTLHLATVVTAGVAPERRDAMLAVLRAFVDDKNAETRREVERARRSAFHKEWKLRAYRHWELHVWELAGPPARWREQLEARQRAQPVFALVSGLADGPWRPIHAFCEAREIPCLLPNTDLPETSPPGFFTVYFSEGVALEARVLARHLREAGLANGRVAQVFRDGAPGAVAARALREALPEAHFDEVRLRGAGAPGAWARRASTPAPDALVLWLGAADLAGLASLAPSGPPLYVSASLAGPCEQALPRALWARGHCVQQLALPDAAARRRPVEAWLRAKGVGVAVDALVLDTHFAIRSFGETLSHLAQNFSQPYLVETLEHRIAASVTPSSRPHLALGAGQRFASKGAYIVRPADGAGVEAETSWIVP